MKRSIILSILSVVCLSFSGWAQVSDSSRMVISPVPGVNMALPSATTKAIYFPYFDHFLPYNQALLTIQANGSANSNAAQAAFSNAFVFPAFISNEMKTTAYDRFEENGRFGLEAGASLQAVFFIDSTWRENQHALTIEVGQKLAYGAAFTEDLMRTVFSGNAAYADKTANFDNSALYTIGYQNFTLGYRKSIRGFGLDVGLGFVRGLNHTSIQLEKGSLYTQPEGQWLDVNWKGDYFSSSRTINSQRGNLSSGFMMNLGFYTHLDSAYLWKLSASVQDLGFINWNGQSDNFSRDTAFRFTGLQFYDVLNYNDTTLVLGDSLVNRLRGPEEKASEMRLLPFTLQAELRRILGKSGRIQVAAGIRYRRIPGMTVQYSLRGRYALKNGGPWSLDAGLSYGGFAKLNTNLGIEFRKNRHLVKIATVYNEGLLNPSNWSGSGILFSYIFSL